MVSDMLLTLVQVIVCHLLTYYDILQDSGFVILA